MNQGVSKNQRMLAVAGLLIIVAVTGLAVAFKLNDKDDMVAVPTTAPTAQEATGGSSSSNATATTGNYKDGKYSTTASYQDPDGTSSIDVSVTLKGGVITDSTVTANSRGTSGRYQEQFIAGYKSQVVGKQIDTVNLSRVSGASLTSQGFNDALTSIKTKAKA